MKQVQYLVSLIAQIKGLAISEDEAIEKGLQSYLAVEHSSHYGGYRVVSVNILNGGHGGALGESSACSRRTKSKMVDFLQGYLNAIS